MRKMLEVRQTVRGFIMITWIVRDQMQKKLLQVNNVDAVGEPCPRQQQLTVPAEHLLS